jgi:membrane protein required for colicin V production
MPWVDLFIALAILLTMLSGLRHGFLRSICSLAGLVMGLALASWNYERVAQMLLFYVRIEAIANVAAFLMIALGVMILASLAGKILSKALHAAGLGFLDKLAGAAFGLVQGALLVMLVILVTLAFYPHARWIAQAQLPKLFFGACHVTARMTPDDLAQRVRHGLSILEDESPQWMHPSGGGA